VTQFALAASFCIPAADSPSPSPPLQVRKRNGINARSKVVVKKSAADVYAAVIDDKVRAECVSKGVFGGILACHPDELGCRVRLLPLKSI
jgi:hypothetical protein